MLYVLALVLIALLVLALLGLPLARGLLFALVVVPVLVAGAWLLWQQEGIGWWALAALALGIPAAWADSRTAAKL